MKKSKVMKPTTSHQEILLFTGTTLASREFSSREENNNKANSAAEELDQVLRQRCLLYYCFLPCC